MPITGPAPARSRAARQAWIAKAGDDVTVHALLAAPRLTCSRTPTAAMASSKWPSIDSTLRSGRPRGSPVPGAATAPGRRAMVSVIARLVLGLITCIQTEDITTPP